MNQRWAHFLSDFPTGVLAFLLVFLAWGLASSYGSPGPLNWLFLSLWLAHYIHRGLITPLTSNYSSRTTPLGIPLAGLFPNAVFAYVNAAWIATAAYPSGWEAHPAFIIGIVFFCTGFVLNRAADLQLRALRGAPGDAAYRVPQGALFRYTAAPNYLGELIEWVGWALMTWSPPGVVWAAFGASTFFPRSKSHRAFYRRMADEAEGRAATAAAAAVAPTAGGAGYLQEAPADSRGAAAVSGPPGQASEGEGAREPLAGEPDRPAVPVHVSHWALIPFLF